VSSDVSPCGTYRDLDEAKKVMGLLVRMPPKPHDEMKVGKPRAKPRKGLAKSRRAASAKR
jgi:hypothetical protein